jgi:predicted  nucleic acid-binding Zn-ribbon protein
MPHKCIHCNKVYEDNAKELISGCGCGGRVFLFLKEKKEEDSKDAAEELRKSTLEEEDMEWLNKKLGKELRGSEKTISFDVENLLRLGKGKYRLNLASLMRGDPLVVKVKDGVYYIDIPYSMRKKVR